MQRIASMLLSTQSFYLLGASTLPLTTSWLYTVVVVFFFFFVCIFFAWIRRSSNEVAHKAARFTINSNMYFVFNKDNLSPALSAACKDDYSPCSSFF